MDQTEWWDDRDMLGVRAGEQISDEEYARRRLYHDLLPLRPIIEWLSWKEEFRVRGVLAGTISPFDPAPFD
jgi:hypothetical protein